MLTCLWCETQVKPNDLSCPECGLSDPAGPAAANPKVSKPIRRSARRVFVVMLALPLILSAALAAHIGGMPLIAAGDASTVAGPQRAGPAMYQDPLQRSVWVNGMRSVHQLINRSREVALSGSFVNVAAGNVVTLCGEITGTLDYDSASGQRRFISVFGEPAATTLEGTDTSFDVLWNRVCLSGGAHV